MLEKDLFETCYDRDYQKSCVQLVTTDSTNNEGRYFPEGELDLALSKKRWFEFQVADDCLDNLNEQPHFIAEVI